MKFMIDPAFVQFFKQVDGKFEAKIATCTKTTVSLMLEKEVTVKIKLEGDHPKYTAGGLVTIDPTKHTLINYTAPEVAPKSRAAMTSGSISPLGKTRSRTYD